MSLPDRHLTSDDFKHLIYQNGIHIETCKREYRIDEKLYGTIVLHNSTPKVLKALSLTLKNEITTKWSDSDRYLYKMPEKTNRHVAFTQKIDIIEDENDKMVLVDGYNKFSFVFGPIDGQGILSSIQKRSYGKGSISSEWYIIADCMTMSDDDVIHTSSRVRVVVALPASSNCQKMTSVRFDSFTTQGVIAFREVPVVMEMLVQSNDAILGKDFPVDILINNHSDRTIQKLNLFLYRYIRYKDKNSTHGDFVEKSCVHTFKMTEKIGPHAKFQNRFFLKITEDQPVSCHSDIVDISYLLSASLHRGIFHSLIELSLPVRITI